MKYSERTAAAMFNSVLRETRRHENRPALHNPWTDDKGRYCVTDGFRAYRLTKAPARVSVIWTSKPDPSAPHGINLDPVFAPLDSGKGLAEMPAPSLDAVKSFVEQERKDHKHGNMYDLGKEYPAVNMWYLYELIRLFPAAKWYVDADPYARMIHPVFVSCSEGTAALLPVRTDSKPWQATKKPAAQAPKKPTAQATPAKHFVIPDAPAKENYFVYSKPAGEKRYLLTNPASGTVGMKKFFAPIYPDTVLDKLKDLLDETAAMNPGASFQIRKADGKTVIYTAVPTFSPELFAQRYAA